MLSKNMTNCISCLNNITCTKCLAPYFLDSGTKNCINNCIYDTNCILLINYNRIIGSI